MTSHHNINIHQISLDSSNGIYNHPTWHFSMSVTFDVFCKHLPLPFPYITLIIVSHVWSEAEVCLLLYSTDMSTNKSKTKYNIIWNSGWTYDKSWISVLLCDNGRDNCYLVRQERINIHVINTDNLKFT